MPPNEKLNEDKSLSSPNFFGVQFGGTPPYLSQSKAPYIMQFKTRQMELSKALDEVFLRLFLLGLRILQALVSIPVIGLSAALISNFSDAGVRLPSKATAAEAIACVCTVYIGLTFLPVFFGGPLFFSSLTVLDALFTAAWITLTVVWDSDGSNTCTAFTTKYFSNIPQSAHSQTDCQLVKAMYALIIVNV
jgi:hypothetical protein